MQLRDYQRAAVDDALAWASTASVGGIRLYSAPTGSGKSIIELAIQAQLGWPILTPSLDIIRGFLAKLGKTAHTNNELITLGEAANIFTPIRFRNKLFRGQIKPSPGLIIDEGHHATADSYQQDWVGLGCPPTLLFTATAYRGSPRETRKLLDFAGEPIVIITIEECAALGHISIPNIEILPLIDDDKIELNSAGEFDVTTVNSETLSRLDMMVETAKQRWFDGTRWDRPTIWAVPSTVIARELAHKMPGTGLILQGTPSHERALIYEACLQRMLSIVQISVVSEGVDLPIRRLIDLAPMMSGRKWMQMLGRIMRPLADGEAKSEYITTNRNLSRHAYLLEGCCPPSKVAESLTAFGGTFKRAGARAIGLEVLGRFKPIDIKLIDGNIAQLYCLTTVGDGRLTEYACIAHPITPQPFWAMRTHSLDQDKKKIYGKWVRCQPPAELVGFASITPKPPTEKMLAWFKRSAPSIGVSTDAAVNSKNFQILPICLDTGIRLARRY